MHIYTCLCIYVNNYVFFLFVCFFSYVVIYISSLYTCMYKHIYVYVYITLDLRASFARARIS